MWITTQSGCIFHKITGNQAHKIQGNSYHICKEHVEKTCVADIFTIDALILIHTSLIQSSMSMPQATILTWPYILNKLNFVFLICQETYFIICHLSRLSFVPKSNPLNGNHNGKILKNHRKIRNEKLLQIQYRTYLIIQPQMF